MTSERITALLLWKSPELCWSVKTFLTLRGKPKTNNFSLNDGDSQTTSLSPVFFSGEGASVHRLRTLSRGKSRSCFRTDKIKKSVRFLTKIVTLQLNVIDEKHDTTQDSRSCVSLLKSKSGSLIRKRIFRFFTKIQKRIIDPNDPQQR